MHGNNPTFSPIPLARVKKRRGPLQLSFTQHSHNSELQTTIEFNHETHLAQTDTQGHCISEELF